MALANTPLNQTAIIIDNNKNYRKSLASIIKQNFKIREIYTCSTGREALGVCRQLKNLDFIFCDSDITDQPVLSLLEELKSNKSAKDANVVLLASNTKKEFLLEAASKGVNTFVLKPFTPKTVTEKIKLLIDGKSQRKTKRIKLFQTVTAHVAFLNVKYKGELDDLSKGGCMINLPTLENGGTIYDQAAIRIIYNTISVDIKAELIRLERDTSSDEKKVKAAFLFKEMEEETNKQFTQLWSILDKSNPSNEID